MSYISNLIRLLHWGPLLALTVITVISLSSITCLLQWWPPFTVGGIINFFIYLLFNVGTLYNFFQATFIGPGYVPFHWQPKKKSDQQFLQYCSYCDGCKAPRSHHCRKCNRCVMKMDHHCPWINNCVGHFNHAYFTYFLFYAPCGCIHSLLILIPTMYRAMNKHYYLYYGDGTEPIVHLGINTFIGCMFATGLAVGVIVAVGGLFYIQVKTILHNETGIETWIKEKAAYREREEGEDEEFIYPYDLGKKENWLMVFSWNPKWKMDGLWWPVKEGCNQYTLTVEQLKQKKEKKDRSVVYDIHRAYSGSFFPITMGPRVCCCFPCTDEARIPLKVGDRVLVTRWKKHWLYGDKILDIPKPQGHHRLRGWFPRKCAVELMQNGQLYQNEEVDTKEIDNGHQPDIEYKKHQ